MMPVVHESGGNLTFSVRDPREATVSVRSLWCVPRLWRSWTWSVILGEVIVMTRNSVHRDDPDTSLRLTSTSLEAFQFIHAT